MKQLLAALRGRPAPETPTPVAAPSPHARAPVRTAPENPTVDSALEAAITHFNLAYAVIINADATLLAEAGTPARLRYPGLVSTLLGPVGSPRNTYDWIQSEELFPQLYGQGGDFALLDKVGAAGVLVVFGAREAVPAGLDAIGNYRWMRSVAKHFQQALESVIA